MRWEQILAFDSKEESDEAIRKERTEKSF